MARTEMAQAHAASVGFSPLREGDTSVAAGAGDALDGGIVSVPFARGTPPWRRHHRPPNYIPQGFSPLREGDTSVAVRVEKPVCFV